MRSAKRTKVFPSSWLTKYALFLLTMVMLALVGEEKHIFLHTLIKGYRESLVQRGIWAARNATFREERVGTPFSAFAFPFWFYVIEFVGSKAWRNRYNDLWPLIKVLDIGGAPVHPNFGNGNAAEEVRHSPMLRYDWDKIIRLIWVRSASIMWIYILVMWSYDNLALHCNGRFHASRATCTQDTSWMDTLRDPESSRPTSFLPSMVPCSYFNVHSSTWPRRE